jgi:hypothetical protein
LRDNVPTRFAPTGDVSSYTNHGYAFVGHLVEQTSDQDFVTYMRDNVFGPLGMENSAFHHELPSGLESHMAVGYVGPAGSRTPGDPVYEREYPGGDVVTTSADMAKFMIALLGPGQAAGTELMNSDTAATYLAAAYRPDPQMPGRTTGGLEELWINGERAVAHGGDSLGGFGAQMVLLPERDTGFFLVYNVDTADEFRENVVAAIFDRYYPDTAAEPSFVDLTSDELERFAGTYQWTRFARSTADKVLAMTPAYTTFVTANDDGTLTVSWWDVNEEWDYRPTGPTTLAKVSGDRTIVNGLVLDPGDRISFSTVNGDVRYLHTSMHTIALERVPIHLTGIVQISTFGTIVVLFILSLIVWPVGALIRRSRDRPRPTGWVLGALWLEIGVALALTFGTVALLLALGSTEAAFGAPPTLYLAAGFITIASVAGLALIPAAVGAWANRWFTIGGRIFYSLLALTAPVLLWWANYWNLLGFRF